MIPPFLSKLTDTEKKESRQERKNKEHFRKRKEKKKEKKDINNKYSGRCCEDMRAKGGEKKEENTDSYRSGGFPGAGSS